MDSKVFFTDDNARSGGFYELIIRLPNDKNIITTTQRLIWKYTELEGHFLERYKEPREQEKLSIGMMTEGHLYGIATMPNKKQICCGSFLSIFDDKEVWMTFYIPIGSLGKAYSVGAFPFKDSKSHENKVWIDEVDDFMIKLAEHIYKEVKFQYGAIGFENDTDEITTMAQGLIPEKRWITLLIGGKKDIEIFPKTVFDSPFSF